MCDERLDIYRHIAEAHESLSHAFTDSFRLRDPRTARLLTPILNELKAVMEESRPQDERILCGGRDATDWYLRN